MMTLPSKKKRGKGGGNSLLLVDDLDATVRGPRTSHSRRVPTAGRDIIGEHEKEGAAAVANGPSGNANALREEARHRPDDDVRKNHRSPAKRRGGLLGRILFGAKSSDPASLSQADASNASSRNDRSSAVTHASTCRSSHHEDCMYDNAAEHNCDDDAELAEFLRQVPTGTSTTSTSCVNDLVEQRRWDVLWKYLQTRLGREEVLGLDLDLDRAEASHGAEHNDNEEHNDDDDDNNTTSTTMSNPLHLALWNGAPSAIVAQLVQIRPSLAVHTDAFGRAALHVACLTTHLDLGLEEGCDEDEDSDDDDDDNDNEDYEEKDTEDQHAQYYQGRKLLDPDLHDGTYDELALAARRLRSTARARDRLLLAQKRQARQLARRHARRIERRRVFAALCTLISTDPSMINRPEAEGLCCIEIAILCGAHNDVVYLLRKCSEAYWKEVERIQKIGKTRAGDNEEEEVTTTTVNGQRLVESVVADMVARGILSASFASEAVGGAASPTPNTSNTGTDQPSGTSTDPIDTSAGHPDQRNRPPLRRGNSWWRRRKRTTLSDYLTQSFHKAGPLLATLQDEMDGPTANNNNNEIYETKTKKKTSTTKFNDKTYKTKKRPTSKKTTKAPPAERAYAKYDIAPAVDIDHEIMGGIFANDDDAFFSYQPPPAGMASATSTPPVATSIGGNSSKTGSTDRKMLKAAKTSYEPHPYLTFGSEDSDSVRSLASSSELSGGGIPLRDDDRNTYRAVTA